MRVYISGRIKDYPQHREHFARVAARLEALGYEAVDPCVVGDRDCPPGATYGDFFRADISAMMECGAICMLDGWERSVGARAEHGVAALCEMLIWYERDLA